jgi:hypothetical protein
VQVADSAAAQRRFLRIVLPAVDHHLAGVLGDDLGKCFW